MCPAMPHDWRHAGMATSSKKASRRVDCRRYERYLPASDGGRDPAPIGRRAIFPVLRILTAIGDRALVNLEGAGMIGVPGTADRLFASLKNAGVSVTLISQASSEHSICVAVPEDVAKLAEQVISEAFAEEAGSEPVPISSDRLTLPGDRRPPWPLPHRLRAGSPS